MMVDDFQLPVLYIQLIAEQLRSMGVSVSAWLARSGLREDRLSDESIPFATFRQLVADSLTVAEEPALGLFVGERLVASTHGFVGYAAVSSSTVGEALSVLEQFMGLRTSLVAIHRRAHGGEHRVDFVAQEPLGAIARPVYEAVVLSVKNVLDDATMGGFSVAYVAFPFGEPEYAPLAQELLDCQVRYGQAWCGLALPESALSAPLTLADPRANAVAAEICQRELAKIEAATSMSARVRRLLLEKRNGFPSLPATARKLAMTPRTLHRRLVAEGTSYRQILEDLRHRLAVDHLRSGRFRVEEVAYILGYTDVANFRRAFKRWTSRPPSHVLPD